MALLDVLWLLAAATADGNSNGDGAWLLAWQGASAALGIAALALAAAYAVVGYHIVRAIRASKPTEPSITKLPNGERVLCWRHDDAKWIYDEVFIDRCYERDGITYAPGSVVIDAGANIGLFSLYAAQRCGGNASIFSCEPMPDTFNVLEQNCNAAMRGQYQWIMANGSKCNSTR